MTLPEPVRAFCYAAAELIPGTKRTPWGLVTVDERFPLVWDANNAAILEIAPGLTVADVEEILRPELRAAGASSEHVEVWETSIESPALRSMKQWGSRRRPDLVMVLDPEARPQAASGVDVREVTQPDTPFWPWFRKSLMEFEDDPKDEVLDQMVERTRAVFVPAGVRWFLGYVDGEMAGYTSLISLEAVGYLDSVVTMPEFRGRGLGAATVSRAIEASQASGDRALFLLTEEDNPARRLYERLGFRVRAKVESFTRPLEGAALPTP